MKESEPGRVRPFAGDGRENIHDGFRMSASFAQPSGLASDGTWLYVADSETSSIRAVGLKQDAVKTLVGRGLFVFGDVDGPSSMARLQHALGVALIGDRIFIADTYNNKIKSIDVEGKAVKTFLGDRRPGKSNKPARFDEPGGLSAAGEKLYVADTNNSAVRVIDTAARSVSTFEIEGLEPPSEVEAESPAEKAIDVKQVQLSKDGPWAAQGKLTVPPGTKLNAAAPITYKVWKIGTDGSTTKVAAGKLPQNKPMFEVKWSDGNLANASAIQIAVTFFPCEEGAEGVCRIVTQAWRIPIQLDANGEKTIQLQAK
jgi:hypothetical protein